MIYLDNAATAWPRPDCVLAAMTAVMTDVGGNPGRSGHRISLEAGRMVFKARETVAGLFNANDPLRVIFTQNATEGLNLALRGYLRPGDHVITSSMEHNSMMRPLRWLETEGVEITVVPCTPEGLLDPAGLKAAVQQNTVMIALNHASNVVGTVQPVAAAGRIAGEHDLLLLVDAAQSAGLIPLDMQRDQIDLLVFTGHKTLLGPPGTGGLLLGERVDTNRLQPLLRGGTGSLSVGEIQPDFLPDRYESGTRNAAGLAGLAAAIEWLQEQDLAKVRRHETDLVQQLIDGLAAMSAVQVYGTADAKMRTGAVSFNIDSVSPSVAGLRLDEEFDILCRVGLHCSPVSHQTIGTFPVGTIRFSPGTFTTAAEIETALAAVRVIAESPR